ncbi:metallophosphoesterase, partial [Xanthobacter aminoxidans]
MPVTFAIGDLHGRFDLLDAVLATIKARTDGGTIVFLGDDVDRGPQSREIIERLMAGLSPGWEWRSSPHLDCADLH